MILQLLEGQAKQRLQRMALYGLVERLVRVEGGRFFSPNGNNR